MSDAEIQRACFPEEQKAFKIGSLRMFIHGARAVLLRVKYDTGGLDQWVHQLEARAARNKVIVAIANKLARIAWAVLSSGKDYQHQPLQINAA